MPQWTNDQLLGVKDLGPSVIGDEMAAAKDALLARSAGDRSGSTIYGPAIVGYPDAIVTDSATPATRDELEALKYAELRGLAAEANLAFEGNPTKIALVEALLEKGIEITIEDEA